MPIRIPRMLSKVKVRELESKDSIIVVIGPTGSGKSAFIAKATENHREDTGQGFCAGSHTKDIQATKFAISNYSNVILVDTPGFDVTTISQLVILTMVSNWLRKTYGRKATAILCFHSITDNRVQWIPHNDRLAVLQGLCEDGAASKISLVTTMWDEVDKEVGNETLGELQDDFWKVMISQGSRVFQHSNTSESARKLIQEVIGNGLMMAIGSEKGTGGLATLDGTHLHDIERDGNTSKSGRKSLQEVTNGSETGTGALAALDGAHSHDVERDRTTSEFARKPLPEVTIGPGALAVLDTHPHDIERKLPQEVTIGSKTGTGALAALDGTCPLDIEKKLPQEITIGSETDTGALAVLDGAHPLDMEKDGNTLESARKSPQEVTIGSETGTGALAAIDGAHPHDIERKSLKEVSEICTEALAAIDGAHPLDIERIGNTSESARKFPQEVIDGFEAGATLAVLDGAQPLDIEKNENTSESARKSPHEATIGSETGSGALAVLDGTHSHDIERNDPTRQYIVLIAILFTSVLGLYYFL